MNFDNTNNPHARLPFTAETANATVNALGAVVMCVVRRLPPAEQQAFIKDLAGFAAACEKSGDTVTETLLIDLYQGAQKFAKPV